MTLAPLKSAISLGNVQDTSLALPSNNAFGSGRQRVLDQVQTVKKAKSRLTIKSGSGSITPTSPLYDNVFIESFKSLPTDQNNVRKEQNINRRNLASQSAKSYRNMSSSSQWERRTIPLGPPVIGRANTSRSEAGLDKFPRVKCSTLSQKQRQSSRSNVFMTQKSHSKFFSNEPAQYVVDGQTKKTSQFVTSQRPLETSQLVTNQKHLATSQFVTSQRHLETSQFVTSQNHLATSQSVTSQRPLASKVSLTESKVSVPKSKGEESDSQRSDITMKEAVEYLSSGDENYQHCGASFIQHSTYTEDRAKQEVLRLNGIPALVALLRSPSSLVQQTASAALRNLAFKDSSNKEEVQRCGGVSESLALLRNTHSSETQKQLTGLLWNLSSADSLKPELVRSALPVLMETVVLPFTGGPDHNTTTSSTDPEVFYHTTGCLRNLSCAKQNNRQAMRKSRGLVDSLVSYVRDCVEADRPDDKSVENCVCVLHNLTFQLEPEAPALFSRIVALARTPNRASAQEEPGPIGCFSQQSSKVEQKGHYDYPVMEEQHPKGAGWLLHSRTMQSYLSLLGSSKKDDTLEASCGALQNLTAGHGIVSHVMSQTIIQKLNGLPLISPLVRSPKPNLQKSAVALVGNLAKNQRMQTAIARQTLPELVAVLKSGTKDGTESDDTLAMACQTANVVLQREPELGKHLVTWPLVNSLNDLTKNSYFPKSSKAAALLLYNLWFEKDIQSFLKKQGMNKASFVNDITTAVHKSVQSFD